MTEILNTLSATGLADVNPYVPPAGWQYVAGTYRVNTQGFGLASGTDAFMRDNKTLNGSPIGCRVKVISMATETRGPALLDNAGNGYVLLCNTTNMRLFAVTNFVTQTGTILKTITNVLVNGDTVDLLADGTSYTVRKNGVVIDTPYIGTSYAGLRAIGCSRHGNGRFSELTSIETSNYLINTLTSPLVPNSSFSGTCTGFIDGAANLSFNGITIPITITSNAFSGTVPMLADNVTWPKLPASGQTITLSQGANSATISRNISLPVGYNVIRDGVNNPINFTGLVADDNTYLQYWFIAASNPLTTNDSVYFPTSGNYLIKPDSGVSADTNSLPRTDTVYIHRANGKIYTHEVILDIDQEEQVSMHVLFGKQVKSSFISGSYLKGTHV